MTAGYENPYSGVSPDHKDNTLFPRNEITRKLKGWLVNVREPSCMSIIAERETGACAAVQRFLSSHAARLPYRVVECDVKSDLGTGQGKEGFYRALVRFVLNKIPHLPGTALRAGYHFLDMATGQPPKLSADVHAFFQAIRERQDDLPLLLVFYSFDRLPDSFDLTGQDWTLLREINDKTNPRACYHLVVSRRPLRYVEDLYDLTDSNFSSIFLNNYRPGLLSEQEARALISQPGQSVMQCPPWSNELTERILQWSGRHPYCLQQICSELFERKWNQHERLDLADASRLAKELGDILRDYFDRLCDHLEDDGLLDPLAQAVEVGQVKFQAAKIECLVDLGYFLPEPAEEGQYVLFSPLFHDYLVRHKVLRSELDNEKATIEPTTLVPRAGLAQDLAEPLSAAELEVLKLMAVCGNNREIAEKRSVSINTVKAQAREIRAKLGVKSRAQAVTQGIVLGLIE